MSESIRQSNLFAAEDYQKIFKAYQFIDYTAYDFDSLKQALINYIQAYYPEDFNDYIESSEFIAIIELIAYLGTSLAFRTELNSRENFIDTAERRESIIRLAQMVNYVPRRNIPASGLFKIASVQTDEPLVDSNGVGIAGVSVFWNDPNNPDWFDQFIQICNSAFSSLNPFGRPTKSGLVGSIPTDLYQVNSVRRLNVTYPFTASINGQQYPIDICNPDFIPNQTIFERHPDPDNAFNFIYRNDSLGVASPNTGFFLYFKQGNLVNVDTNFDFPVPNRVFPVGLTNINQDDVYVQETDESGNVLAQWAKVPALAGENIIYNSIRFSQRNIFDVISGPNDTISIRFADGNFGNVPTGLFRTWVRTSANQALVIRPNDVQGVQLDLPYIGADEQNYTLRITFNLEQTIANAAAAETDDQIKLRAPEVFSTQSRMVNGSDYNVLPLIYGNQIAKIQAINRTYSGHSRYLDLNDPTGFHKDLVIFGEDGALYRDDQNVLQQVVKNSTNSGNIENILIDSIQELLRDKQVRNFFYDEYLPQFEAKIRVNAGTTRPTGYSILEINNPNQQPLYWKASPIKSKNDTGYFSISTALKSDPEALVNSFSTYNIADGQYQPWGMIRAGASIVLKNDNDETDVTLNSAPVNNVVQFGLSVNTSEDLKLSTVGPVELGKEEGNNYRVTRVYPAFRNTFNEVEVKDIVQAIGEGIPFWLYYDLLQDRWGVSLSSTINIDTIVESRFRYPAPIVTTQGTQIYSDWASDPYGGIVYVSVETDNELAVTTYDLTARGRVYAFESYRDVRFFWEPDRVVIDSATGQALQDTVNIMPMVNTNRSIDNNIPVIVDPTTSFLKNEVSFNISGVYVQDDGYRDTSKVKVSLVDTDGDGISDDPAGFEKIVSPADRVVFEYYDNFVAGYQSTRPWVANWNTDLKDYTGKLYIYFPIDPADSTRETLFGAPFISDTLGLDPINPTVSPYPASPTVTLSTDGSSVEGTTIAASTVKVYREYPGTPSFTTTSDYQGSYYVTFGSAGFSEGEKVFVTVTNSNGYESNPTVGIVGQPDPTPPIKRTPKLVYMDDVDLVFINNIGQIEFNQNFTSQDVTIANQLTYFFNSAGDTLNIGEFAWIEPSKTLKNKINIVNQYFASKSFLIYSISPPGQGVYYRVEIQVTTDTNYPTLRIVNSLVDKYHFDKNGKVFTQNTTVAEDSRIPLYFKWNHYSPIDQRIDPSTTNIVDMIVVTENYYRDVLIWKNSNNPVYMFPQPPTTEELRIQFQNLNDYKMVSDSMIWNSGKFKILFGQQAEKELQATFKVVKAPSANISDNEVKTRVIRAIDTYFDIRNWDFGEKFFYTELAAFIHQQLSRIISSVVIVPNNSDSEFGNLFEISANPDELFLSTATVANVQIVANLTEQNLRV